MKVNNVVVTGMGVVSSIGGNINDFCRSLYNGISGLEKTGEEFGAGNSLKVSATIKDFSFEKSLEQVAWSGLDKAKIMKSIRRMPMAVQTSVLATLQAWKQSCIPNAECNFYKTAIIVAGSNLSQNYIFETAEKFIKSPGFVNPTYAIRFFDTNFVGVISEVLGITGEGITVGGASASGNSALIQAHRMVKYGMSDICLCIGPMFEYSAMEIQAFSNLGAIGDYECFKNPKEACRPFDMRHKGFVPGQASGCLIFESEANANKRGASVLAKMLGGAIVLDANHLSNADIHGESQAMLKALAEAGISIEYIDYINAHGTSTPSGDEVEADAITEVFGEQVNRIWINSTKCLTGHCIYSAGIIEAISCILQMQNNFIHGNINLLEPIRPNLKFVGKEVQKETIHYAMSNSFGFGGINTSIILQG